MTNTFDRCRKLSATRIQNIYRVGCRKGTRVASGDSEERVQEQKVRIERKPVCAHA